MRTLTFTSAVPIVVFSGFALAQNPPPATETRGPQPLYQVTIVSRTTKALNYGYLTAPTRIDFKGTPVLPDSHGDAVVEPKRGATLLKLRFENVPPPTRFGQQYLTYVVWAISPDGRAQNLGELALNASNKGKLTTSTPLQTFAMIVTAEPYYSVTQPSDVVVMENMVGPGTVGKVQEVNATYELLPRKPYTYDMTAPTKPGGPAVSMDQYEATTAMYQALNAIQIAQSQGADKYDPERMARARQIYNQARGYPASLSKEIISMAREATQIAEDSRAVAIKRAEADKAADEQKRATEVQPPPTQSSGSGPAASIERAPTRVERQQISAKPVRNDGPAVEVDPSQFTSQDPQATDNRKRLLSALPKTYEVVDSPRGIIITLPESMARSSFLQGYLSPMATAISRYKDLHIAVEGHSDVPDSIATTESEARSVKQALMGIGIAPDSIAERGLGNTRPRTSNANSTGRQQNRRVEIVIAGDSIGSLPTWDRTYKLQPVQVRR